MTLAGYTNAGNEFIVGFGPNRKYNPEDRPTFGKEAGNLTLYVTTNEQSGTSFTISWPDMTQEERENYGGSRNIGHLEIVAINLPLNLRVDVNPGDGASGTTRKMKGIRVKADEGKTIVVYGFNQFSRSSDAYLALPCDGLVLNSYEYYGIGYAGENRNGVSAQRNYKTSYLLVGCKDNTKFSIQTPPDGPYPEKTNMMINRQEAILVWAKGIKDLTGTHIVADKPISFFPGHESSTIPCGVGAYDLLTEQVPPTATWGKFFLSASFGGRESGEIYRILAAHNSTTVSVKCDVLVKIRDECNSEECEFTIPTQGGWKEFRTAKSGTYKCSIESNKPVLVMEFSLSHKVDILVPFDNEIADPFMLMLPPVEQYSKKYAFALGSRDDDRFRDNYITMYLEEKYFLPDQIFIDDQVRADLSWEPVRCMDGTICGRIATEEMSVGTHTLEHRSTDPCARIGLAAYGFDDRESYGYPGGIRTCEFYLQSLLHA